MDEPGRRLYQRAIVGVETGRPRRPSSLSRNQTILTKTYWGGTWNSTWTQVGGRTLSRPILTACVPSQVDVYALGLDRAVVHSWSDFNDGYWTRGIDAGWENLGGYCTATPAVICGSVNRVHIMVYGVEGNTQPAYYNQWNGQWSGYTKIGGDFRGEPCLVRRGDERFDFFGVGPDGAMYHSAWNSTAGFSSFTNLGGSFITSPHAFATGLDRLDVLGVGTDDGLKHKALIGSTWSSDWEDLGGAFNSTPATVTVTPGKISVYGVGQSGTLFHGTWTIGSDFTWKDGPNWLSDGGYTSTDYYMK
ncbi:hypothetical protein B0J13DRAFT_156246 [Dactylonectria estremocensis]|uniref:PLL-like beta propeller domain-containing protein n=1 Tax=Dactylonectria estremocensis TaxID=1079267 RepID=A0A9P9IIS2_9HYPO|nr:hypothetical protein B0J13DRAFT_156246 [Dactylonectria estremocensis]